MMTVLIEDFSFEAVVGILKEERLKAQTIVVNARVDYDYKAHGFLDYMKLCKEIKKEFQSKRFKLLEEAAVSIAETLKSKNQEITMVTLKIIKTEIRSDAKVGIIFEKNFC